MIAALWSLLSLDTIALVGVIFFVRYLFRRQSAILSILANLEPNGGGDDDGCC